MTIRNFWILLVVSLTFGCAEGAYESTARPMMASGNEDRMAAIETSSFHDANKRMPPASTASAEIETFQTSETQSAETKGTERQIIYTAEIELVVNNFDGFAQKVTDVVQRHGGYLAATNLDRMQGQRRSGRWTARVPVSKYEVFLEDVRQLGVPTSQIQNAQDVTEEFVDLQARIANKRKLEQRVLELLERPEDEIQHVIEVERELARIREEIERMEGRLRYLRDQTALTTVEITAREERDYVPPEAPTLGNRVSSAWTLSLDRTGAFIQNAIVFLVGNFIAMIAWIVVIVLGLLLMKAVWKRIRRSPQTVSATESQ